ncbi:MAG: V-type ATPase 116kDa subunit family protein [Pseudomonadota bacterium]
MSLRTREAHWFELLTVREELPRAVDCMAHTGAVELETRSSESHQPAVEGLEKGLADYQELKARFGKYWPPEAEWQPDERSGVPEKVFTESLGRVESWCEVARPLVERLEAIHGEEAELARVADFFSALGDAELPPPSLLLDGPTVAGAVFRLESDRSWAELDLPPGVITRLVTGDATHLVAIGPVDEVADLERDVRQHRGRRLSLPAELGDTPARARENVAARRRQLADEAERLQRQLGRMATEHGLRGALGEIERLLWFIREVRSVAVSEEFAWLTGWTSEDADGLQEQLDDCGVQGLVRVTEPPPGVRPPMVFHNPIWARPFELFARLLGTPDRNEADPSRLLAVIVPLMFGFMFGDVGHGLIFAGIGLWLRRRYPMAGILVPAGVMSSLFGFLYGTIFSLEILPALWLRPMEEPLIILLVPLLGGVVILLLGLLLNGVEAFWGGRIMAWWRQEAGVLVAYLGLLGGVLVHPLGYAAAGLGVGWYLLGGLYRREGSPVAALFSDLGGLVESGFQLVVNTLSFARVGAFALAHGGLALAVEALAEAGGNIVVAVIILIIGNGVIMALEGLIVSIQITRLVLFEFFVRFLRGEGRPFRPLSAQRQGSDTTTTGGSP